MSLAHAVRTVSRVPHVGGRPRLRATRVAGRFPCHRPRRPRRAGRERDVRESVPQGRASAREARPVSNHRRPVPDSRERAGAAVVAQPLGWRPQSARHRRTVRAAVLGNPPFGRCVAGASLAHSRSSKHKRGFMNSVFFDSALGDDARRERLYAGQLFVYAPVPSALKLVELARELIREAFGTHDPNAKVCLQGILGELGCDLTKTYFDVPRMRTATSENYLTSGIAYAFHPHRDTWYSAPFTQINWWLPIFEIQPSNAMAFHPRYWSQPVRNGSREYNYDEWNRTSRVDAAKHIKEDTRKQPKPEEPLELDPQIRLLPPVGGMILFSGAQMHSTVPNDSGRTRFSIDFRTVHYGDVGAGRGAPNIDSECTGTSLGDFLRATDLKHVPEELGAR